MKKLTMLKSVLYNLKWIFSVFTIIYGFQFIESASDGDGISLGEEYIMYTFWMLLIFTLLLFIYNKKWISFVEEHINKKDK